MPHFLKESMTLKWNFWRGGGFKLKNLLWEGYGYFLEHTHYLNLRQLKDNKQSQIKGNKCARSF